MSTGPTEQGDILAKLESCLDARDIMRGDDIPQHNRKDWAEWKPSGEPLALVTARTTQQVSAILRQCNACRQPVVIQGGMTGLAGGATPQAGEIAISLEKLRGIEDIDTVGRTMTVLAGTTLREVQQAAEAADLYYGVDLGSRDTCTIGGNVATNAGGIQVLRYGMTRRNVVGIEAVLADGTVVRRLNKLSKDNTGYNWRELLVGSEGTLGVITRVVLALQPRPAAVQSALCRVTSVDNAYRLLAGLEAAFPASILAFEAMWREYLDMARLVTTMQPFDGELELVILCEAALGQGEPLRDAFVVCLSDLMEQGVITDANVAQSSAERERFWSLREAVYEIDRVLPKSEHFDVGLPFGRMDEGVQQLRNLVAKTFPASVLIVYGHLGDGNIHLAVSPRAQAGDADTLKTGIYEIICSLGGSISDEHGIGVLKRPYLHCGTSAAELSIMRSLKSALDPNWILGKGRILD